MTETIQSIFIRETETRPLPKPHSVFRIEIHAAVRVWSVWKRYSEFETLHEQLVATFPSHPPPMSLPPKHWWSSTIDHPELLEERRAGLEDYLRGILSDKDDRWRLLHEWNEFLAVPVSRNTNLDLLAGLSSSSSSSGGVSSGALIDRTGGAIQFFTTESWLEEYRNLQSMAREVRSLINRRDTHLGRSEISASHNCTIQAKKLLTALGLRIPTLENGLITLASGNSGASGVYGGGGSRVMSDGELRRRQDMLAEIKDEREVLTKLVIANRQNDGYGTGGGNSNTTGAVPASSGDRNVLLTNDRRTSSSGGMPTAGNGGRYNNAQTTSTDSSSIMSGHSSASTLLSTAASGSRRVFGKVVQNLQETSQTRGLDNEGLLLLQQEQMAQQDNHIEQFNAILQRQKHIGLAIGQELDTQIQMLDDLDKDVDRTTVKLGLANKKISRIH